MMLWEILDCHEADLEEKWTKKYKKSINCSKPQGFSQRAHCAARRKRRSGGTTTSKSINEDSNLSGATKISKLLSMDPQTFDQTPQGWRSLVHGNNFEDAIQALKAYIKTYVRDNQFVDPPEGEEKWDSPGLLFWHLGQLLAMQNKYQQAAEWMTRSKNADDPDAEWDNYVDATLAFLKGDKYTLNKIAGQPNYNSNTIKRLAQGIGKPYQQVYEQQASGTLTIKSVSESRMDTLVESMLHNLQSQGLTEAEAVSYIDERLDENLRKWFKQKWVRFGPDGKIRGACARGSEGEGKPKCLPQKKAWALGKKKRATAAARKRREDPNPRREGEAKNVATKESQTYAPEVFDETSGPVYLYHSTSQPLSAFRRNGLRASEWEDEELTPYIGPGIHYVLWYTDRLQDDYGELTLRFRADALTKKDAYSPDRGSFFHDKQPFAVSPGHLEYLDNGRWWLLQPAARKSRQPPEHNNKTKNVATKESDNCPHCGGEMVDESLINEKQDACYYKVKSRYKVWPSAYASGALVQCRKRGAKNWGNKGKKR